MLMSAGTDPPAKKKGKYAVKADKIIEDPVSCVKIKLNSLWNPAFDNSLHEARVSFI